MNAQTWLDGNTNYLSCSLAWLRLKLEMMISSNSQALFDEMGSAPGLVMPTAINRRAGLVQEPGVSSSVFWQQLFSRPVGMISTPLESDAPPVSATQERLKMAQAARESAAQMEPAPALEELGQRLGLTPFEQNVLLLCAALELDTRIAGLCARAQADPNARYATFALAMALFDDPAWDALAADRPLRYWRLVEINQPGAQPLTTSAVRADERIVNYLKGMSGLDDRLSILLSPLSKVLQLPPSQQAAADAIIAHWQNSVAEHDAESSQLPIAQLLGPDPISKQLVAAQAAQALGLKVYTLAAENLPAQLSDLETLARLWQRESALNPVALYLDVQELGGADGAGNQGSFGLIQRFISRADGILLLGTRENWTQLSRANFSVDIDKPSTAEQQELWESALARYFLVDSQGSTEMRSSLGVRQLAAQFNLNETSISQIVKLAVDGSDANLTMLGARLWELCCTATRPRLDALAQRIELKESWDNLVLPVEQANLLHQIAHQVGQRQTVYEDWGFAERMNRGMGISALFAGESGTGKTMAAEVIANELKLNLYRIDLSAVVSKYIGETEKNLRRLFDAAEDGGAILFFDEADAMFGKRSEVKDSHDRYANIEVNYLLQRMETYRGLAILATNMKSALDTAFMRRLRFIVNFPFPGPNERKNIWQKVFPAKTPIEELDYDRLARFNITGGNIHSIALNAAFMAAQDNSKVSMPVVLSAIRSEYRKLDKQINEAEFQLMPGV